MAHAWVSLSEVKILNIMKNAHYTKNKQGAAPKAQANVKGVRGHGPRKIFTFCMQISAILCILAKELTNI